MSVAIAWPELQYLSDVNVSPAVGVDEYALTYDHDTAKFVLRAPFAGMLATGATVGATAQAQAFTLGVVSPFDAPAADSTTAWQVRKADKTTAVVTVDTTNGRVGIGTTSPAATLDVQATAIAGAEQILKVGISDTADYFYIANNTSTNARFDPVFGGYTDRAAGYPLTFSGGVLAAQDTGVVPLVTFEAKRGSSVSPWGAVVNRDLFDFSNYGTSAMRIKANGNVGIGTTAPATLLHAVSTTATTNALRNVLTLGANVTSTDVGAAGLGAAVLFQAESTTTVDSDMAQIGALWTTATHATRASALTFSTLTAGGSLTESARIFRTSIGGYVKAIGGSWVELYSGQTLGGQLPGILYSDATGFILAACSADDHSGSVNARLSITTTGYVGLNTAAASSFLHVQGDIGNGITINDQNDPTVEKWMIHTGVAGFTRNGLSFSRTGTGGGGTSAPVLSIKNDGKIGINDTAPAEMLDVTGNANVTGVYKVDDVQVLSNRVIDARCADVANSGDATTDGLIDALRDAMVAHGLIAAA